MKQRVFERSDTRTWQFFENSEADPVGTGTTQSCHSTINIIGLSISQSQLKSRRQMDTDSPLSHISILFPGTIML